jgi:hypothetical protein
MTYNEPKLYYEDGSQVGCVITNYTPPVPVIKLIKNKPLKGNTHFQKINGKDDTKIRFSAAFNISECTKAEYQKFLTKHSDLFTFVDEYGTNYTGRIDNDPSNDMPIEGDIYYIGVELLCNCEVSGT